MREFNESELFYDKVLINIGFKIDYVAEDNFGKIKSYKQGEHNLWIRFDRNKESEQFVRNVGIDHLAFKLNSPIGVDKAYKLIKKLNVRITRKPKKYPEYSSFYYAFYFRDPNGIPLEIYSQ